MESEISLISVGTPSGAGGGQSLAALDAVVSSIGQAIRHKNEAQRVVVRSTVAPRTTEERVAPKLEAIVGRELGNCIGICFNPEFFREGAAVRDFFTTPFPIVGTLAPGNFAAVHAVSTVHITPTV